jgi:hypothetical protein
LGVIPPGNELGEQEYWTQGGSGGCDRTAVFTGASESSPSRGTSRPDERQRDSDMKGTMQHRTAHEKAVACAPRTPLEAAALVQSARDYTDFGIRPQWPARRDIRYLAAAVSGAGVSGDLVELGTPLHRDDLVCLSRGGRCPGAEWRRPKPTMSPRRRGVGSGRVRTGAGGALDAAQRHAAEDDKEGERWWMLRS